MDSWWENYAPTIKTSSQIAIKSQIENYLRPAFGSYKLDKLTPAIIQQQVNKWARDYNQNDGGFKRYGQLHSYNKRILQYGVSLQALKSNPAKNVLVPKVKAGKAKIKHFTDSELKQFFEYLDSLDQKRFKNLFCITLYKFLLATVAVSMKLWRWNGLILILIMLLFTLQRHLIIDLKLIVLNQNLATVILILTPKRLQC